MQTNEQPAEKTEAKSKTLTLTKIRELSNSCELEKCRQALAESMTIEDSDEEGLAALAAYKAIYRWAQENYDVAAPAEHMVQRMIFHISIGPLCGTHVDMIADEATDHFDCREGVRAAYRKRKAILLGGASRGTATPKLHRRCLSRGELKRQDGSRESARVPSSP